MIAKSEQRSTRAAARLAGLWFRAVVIALVAALLGGGVWLASRFHADHRSRLVLLAAEEVPDRAAEGRLTGDSRYRPAPAIRRSAGETPQPGDWRLMSIAAATRRVDRSVGSASNLHAASVGELLLGDPVKSAELLQIALVKATGSSDVAGALQHGTQDELLNDFSVVMHARGVARTSPEDFVVSLEAAERSYRLKRSPQAAWNRALNLQALHLRDEAWRAWDDYLAIESDADWAAEARRRKSRLPAPANDRWLAIKSRLDAISPVSPVRSQTDDVIREAFEDARIYGEEELLSTWARRSADGDSQGATRALMAATAVGSALASQTGDRLLLATVRAIESADGKTRMSLIEGHLRYAKGRAAYGAQKMAEAAEELAKAEEELRAGGSDFASRACLYSAMSQYHSGRAGHARDTIKRCFIEPRPAYTTLTADALWAKGLFATAAGEGATALSAYLGALDLFTQAREGNSVTALHGQLATLYTLLGDSRSAWSHRHRALEASNHVNLPAFRKRVLLLDVARAASTDGCPLVAIRIQNIIVGLSRQSGDPFALANALQLRSRYLVEAGMVLPADKDVTEAEEALSRIADVAVRARATANVRMARAQILRRTDPVATCKLLAETIDHLRSINNPLLLPDLLVEMARCQSDQGLLSAASLSIGKAMSELSVLNENVGPFDRRRAHLDSYKRVRQAAIEIFADHKAYLEAYRWAERFDAQLERGDPLRTASDGRDHATLKYAVLSDRLLIWLIRDQRISTYTHSISSRELQSAVQEMTEACSSRDDSTCRESLAELRDHLIKPLPAPLPMNLTVLPDGLLLRVPFGALYDRRTKTHLIEHHAVAIGTCTTCPERGSFSARRDRVSMSALAIGNPAPLTLPLPSLPAAEEEARDVARLYGDSRLLVASEATKARILEAIRDSDIVHFAGHAVANLEVPGQSALVLADDGSENENLIAAEIASLDLNHVQVVVLSACNTGVGKMSFGGPLSVADAFVRAGAGSVVATLWEANDEGARDLLKRFHAAFETGHGAAEALREAQLAMLSSNDELHRSPSNWAAFQTIN